MTVVTQSSKNTTNAVSLHFDRSEYFFRIIDLLLRVPIIAALQILWDLANV